MSKLKDVRWRCSVPKPKKDSTEAVLCVPFTQDTVERHWNWAISGVPPNASRAPSRASTLTPLSTMAVVMIVLRSFVVGLTSQNGRSGPEPGASVRVPIRWALVPYLGGRRPMRAGAPEFRRLRMRLRERCPRC
jgi:hypothetical protein